MYTVLGKSLPENLYEALVNLKPFSCIQSIKIGIVHFNLSFNIMQLKNHHSSEKMGLVVFPLRDPSE